MDRRQLHHLWTKVRRIRWQYFLALALLSGLVAVFALRANNQEMIRLRQQVWDADQAGSDVQAPLKALQSYVTSHMNTDLNAGRTPIYPPIQLKYTYERLVKAQNDAFLHQNSQLYSDAQKLCEAQNPTDFSGRNRVPCIEQYVLAHTSQKPAQIPEALYKFAFISPRWSPDLAGWSIVVCFLAGLLTIASFFTNRWLRKAAN